jgi:hypothetical protein
VPTIARSGDGGRPCARSRAPGDRPWPFAHARSAEARPGWTF